MRRSIPTWYRILLIVVAFALGAFALGNHVTRGINAFYHPSMPNPISAWWVWSAALAAVLLVGEAVFGLYFSRRDRIPESSGSMSDQPQLMNVFIDLLPNHPKNDQTRDNFRQMLRQRFEERLPEVVERVWELPPIILKEPFEDYLALLLEARELFLAGHFYACVAMCGIVGERLVKDLLRQSVFVEKHGQVLRPADAAFDQFERVEVNGIVRFLKEADLLNGAAAKAAEDLGQLRNKYAHARGKEPQRDALDVIKLLHALVEATVSALKDFEIKDGALARKATAPNSGT